MIASICSELCRSPLLRASTESSKHRSLVDSKQSGCTVPDVVRRTRVARDSTMPLPAIGEITVHRPLQAPDSPKLPRRASNLIRDEHVYERQLNGPHRHGEIAVRSGDTRIPMSRCPSTFDQALLGHVEHVVERDADSDRALTHRTLEPGAAFTIDFLCVDLYYASPVSPCTSSRTAVLARPTLQVTLPFSRPGPGKPVCYSPLAAHPLVLKAREDRACISRMNPEIKSRSAVQLLKSASHSRPSTIGLEGLSLQRANGLPSARIRVPAPSES